MARITNFVPEMPIFSNLGRTLSSVMAYPTFSPSNPLIGPKTHRYPSKYFPKHVFFLAPHPQNRGGSPYFPFNTHPLVRVGGGGVQHCQTFISSTFTYHRSCWLIAMFCNVFSLKQHPWVVCIFVALVAFCGGRRGRTVRCAKSRLCSTTGSHGSQGPEFCTPMLF